MIALFFAYDVVEYAVLRPRPILWRITLHFLLPFLGGQVLVLVLTWMGEAWLLGALAAGLVMIYLMLRVILRERR